MTNLPPGSHRGQKYIIQIKFTSQRRYIASVCCFSAMQGGCDAAKRKFERLTDAGCLSNLTSTQLELKLLGQTVSNQVQNIAKLVDTMVGQASEIADRTDYQYRRMIDKFEIEMKKKLVNIQDDINFHGKTVVQQNR
jgi:hypothetical protein